MRDQHLGSEFKAVAEEAMHLGMRCAKAGRDWLTGRRDEMGRRDQGEEQRYAQEDARRGGRQSQHMHGSSPNQPRGRNQWNDPSSRHGQEASHGSDWDRDIGDVSGGSGREYGHSNYSDGGYDQGTHSQQDPWQSPRSQHAGGGSDQHSQGRSDIPGAGMQGSGRNQAYSQHGE
ncbi:MAG: hypothetical protein KY442_10335, partial [Proteobacteria bacterium]|nr:hypothetical protein [Pseudomonadota bacterium]